MVRIDLKVLVEEGKIIARLGGGKRIESERSVMKLNGKLRTILKLVLYVKRN